MATSKPESAARVLLEHLGLADAFVTITGANDDETRSDKAEVIEEALRRLRERGVDLANPVMVGDRHHDIAGAVAHDVPAIWVAWGYGEPAEATQAIASAEDATQLRELLMPGV